MKKISREDLISHKEYTKVADKFLRQVIAEKKVRRMSLNDRMSGLFETRLTIWYQIMEMIRAEQIEDESYINEMLEVYNELVSEDHELSMTLFVEIPNQMELRTFNKTIVGIEDHVQLTFGDMTVTSYELEDGEEADDHYTQSVHYLRLPFTNEQKLAFVNYNGDVFITVNHPNFKSEQKLSAALVESLKKDLQA
ncbi:DUF3501 family protein [Microbacteriaceae bacterium 4G12]